MDDDVKELERLLVKIKGLLGVVVVGFLFMFYVVDGLSDEIRSLRAEMKANVLTLREERTGDFRAQGAVNLNLKAVRDKHELQLKELERSQ